MPISRVWFFFRLDVLSFGSLGLVLVFLPPGVGVPRLFVLFSFPL